MMAGMSTSAAGAIPTRFGASQFANTVPLLYRLREVCPGAVVVPGAPSAMPVMLAAGEVDAALVPVAALLEETGMKWLPDAGVCARGEVRSVLVRLNRPLEQVRRVRRDPASRTSNELARIVLSFKTHSPVVMVAADSPEPCDAEVVIGDRALMTSPGVCGDLDLGAEWNAMTGLPFVFAAWACRVGDPSADLYAAALRAARDAGVAAIDEIARAEARRLGLADELCADYFTRCIHYRIGPLERGAMNLFGRFIAGGPVL